MLALAAISLGIIGGSLSGGALAGIGRIRLRFEWAVLAAFLVQGVARGRLSGTTASSAALTVWVSVSVLLAVLLLANHRMPGALVAGAGVLINADVVLLNHGMPVALDVSRAALAAIAGSGGFYHLAGSATVMTWAGDVLQLRALGGLDLLSIGDLLLVVGVAVVVASAMIESRRRSESPPEPV